VALAALTLIGSVAPAEQRAASPGDPGVRNASAFDARRPVEQELRTNVPDGFTFGAVGDLIISRPLSQYAGSIPEFRGVIDVLKSMTVMYGNMETAIFDVRNFTGSPYSWDGDWTNAAVPGVARDLRAMGFAIVSRANNHALDWGIEGMRETSRWLDDAGIVHAGVGENRGLARAPRYLETPSGRVALVSLASTFRPTTDSLPAQGATPGRAGVNALHLSLTIALPDAAMKSLANLNCTLYGKTCHEDPAELSIFEKQFRRGASFEYEYAMDPEDLLEIYQSIRAARENADFVVVSIHSHECATGCDDDDAPRGAGRFLKELAHGAIDAGADVFVATGNHNLGPMEIYKSAARGYRPIFYGLGNFFWSDVQELLSHDLFQSNRPLLERAWLEPGKATEYDLTAPLNKVAFAHAFTFESVIAECRFEHNQLAAVVLRPVQEGYGSRLLTSGIPRLVQAGPASEAIIQQIVQQTARLGLPKLNIKFEHETAVVRP
jgi:poly-gamma-glutamate synthesis protein (capsule biosynthesis protein)